MKPIGAALGALARRVPGPLLGAALGLVVAILGFGPDYVAGTKSFWSFPPTDFNSHLIGWRTYVQDAWSWPPLATRKLEQPYGIQLLMMDALPPIAFMAKLVRPLVPTFAKTLWLNPLGWWQAVSFALQGLFGALVIRRLGGTKLAQVSGAAVVCSAQILILRFYHTALSSHFILICALYMYLGRDRIATLPRRVAFEFAGLLAFAALLHPYLLAMASAILFAPFVSWIRQRRLREVALVGGAVVAAVLPAMWLAGYFGAETGLSDPTRTNPLQNGARWFGYGFKSTDLASFFVPQYSLFIPTPPSLRIDMARDEIAEGWDYLGLGVLALAVLGAARGHREILAAVRRHLALSIILLGMAAYAVSNRVSFGKVLLFELPLPDAVGWLVSQYRSCGRFIWPATYAGSLFLVALAYRRFTAGWLRFGPPLLVLVQFIDGMGNFTYVHGYTARPEVRFLDWDVFRPLVREHTGVTVLPAIACTPWQRPIVAFANLELEFLAAEKGLGQAAVRNSKPRRDCLAYPVDQLHEPIDRERLYVYLRPSHFEAKAIHFERVGLPCYEFELGFACSRHVSPAVPGFTAVPSRPNYRLGSLIHFGVEAEDGAVLGDGWSYPEGNHRWTEGPRAMLYLHFAPPLAAGSRLHLVASGAVVPGRPHQTASITIQERPVATLDFDNLDPRPFDVTLPPELAGATLAELEITISDSRPPVAIGPLKEVRSLGVALSELRIDPP